VHSFKDKNGREWRIELNITTVRRVRNLTGVDLLAYGTKEVSDKLGDIVSFCDVIFAACSDQAKADGVSDEDFGRAMWGDPIGDAITALEDELVDFFQNARLRESLANLIKAGREVREKSLDVLQEMTDPSSIREQATKYLAKLRNSSGDVPVPSDSIQAATQSAN